MPLLYLRYAVPLLGLGYLIKKNPFYRTYPIMLPIMFVGFCGTFIAMCFYSRRTNHMVH